MSDPRAGADREPAVAAACAADAKKAERTVILDVGALIEVTDSFVITSGTSNRQVRTIAEHVEEEVAKRSGRKPLAVEGITDATWVLLDYGEFVVHVFDEETRAYYDLERLWSDAPRIEWRPLAQVAGANGAQGTR